jgi:hypothetical protein
MQRGAQAFQVLFRDVSLTGIEVQSLVDVVLARRPLARYHGPVGGLKKAFVRAHPASPASHRRAMWSFPSFAASAGSLIGSC